METLQVTYGIHAVEALFERRRGDVRELMILEGSRATAVNELKQRAHTDAIKVTEVSAAKLKRVSGDGVHQGVVALGLPRPEYSERSLEQMLAADRKRLFLVLDGVENRCDNRRDQGCNNRLHLYESKTRYNYFSAMGPIFQVPQVGRSRQTRSQAHV